MNKQKPPSVAILFGSTLFLLLLKTPINSDLNNMNIHYIREFYSNLELGQSQGAQATEMPYILTCLH